MTDAEIKAGFRSIDPGHTFFRALMALLDNEVNNEQDAATVPDLTDGARHFNSGRVACARDLRRSIEGVMKESIQEQAEAVAKAERSKNKSAQ